MGFEETEPTPIMLVGLDIGLPPPIFLEQVQWIWMFLVRINVLVSFKEGGAAEIVW